MTTPSHHPVPYHTNSSLAPADLLNAGSDQSGVSAAGDHLSNVTPPSSTPGHPIPHLQGVPISNPKGTVPVGRVWRPERSQFQQPGRVTKSQCGVWPTSIGRCGPRSVPDAGPQRAHGRKVHTWPQGAWHLRALRVLFGSQREQFCAISGVRSNREIDHSLHNPCSRHICGNRLFYPTGTVTVDLGCLLCRGAGVWLECLAVYQCSDRQRFIPSICVF